MKFKPVATIFFVGLAGTLAWSPLYAADTALPEVEVRGSTNNFNAYRPYNSTTGAKTDTPLRDLPQSVQVIPQQLMKDQGGYSLDTTIRNASGVTQSSSSNYGFFNNYLVRGLSANYLRDGIPDGLTVNGYARTLADAERVEVLKGPGSALYGSGAPGGSINLITKKPLDKAEKNVEFVFGSFATRRALVDLTGPLGSANDSYRVIGDYSKTDGFRGLANETGELLPSFFKRFNSDNTLLVDYDYRHNRITSDTVGIPFHASATAALNSTDLISVPRETRLYTPFSETTQTVNRLAVTHEYKPDASFTLRQNLVYLGRDLNLLRNAASATFTTNNTLASRSVREQSDNGKELLYQIEPVWKFGSAGKTQHTLLTGFEYHRTDIHAVRSVSNLAPIADVFAPVIPEQSKGQILFAPQFDRQIVSSQTGLYAQDQIIFSDHWKARIGLRWDHFDIRDNGTYNTLFDAGGAFTGTLAANGQSFNPKAATLQYQTASRSDNRISSSAGVVYQPNEAISWYAGVARGSQAIVSTEAARSAYAPESSMQYEIGSKLLLLDDRLSINTALFDVTRADFLQTINGISTPVGEQNTRGVEADFSFNASKGLYILANYALQNARYTRFKTATGADDPNSIGRRVTGVPRHSASLWATYEFQDPALKGWGIGAGANYKDSIYIDTVNTQQIPSYTTGDLLLFYRQKQYELQLNVTNFTNANWYRNGVNGGASPGDPRAIYATVRFKF